MSLDENKAETVLGFNPSKEGFTERLALVLRLGKGYIAEELLATLAHTEGDEMLEVAAQRMTPAQVAEVTRHADIVKPSLLHQIISPSVVPAVFRRIGVGWSVAQSYDCDSDILEAFQKEMQDFFCAFVLISEDEKRRKEVLGALLAEPAVIEAMVFAVIGEKDFREFLNRDGTTTETGDWREMLALMRTHFPADWSRFKEQVPADLDPESDEYLGFVNEIAAQVYEAAVAEGAVTSAHTEPAEQMFKPLD